MSEEPLRPDESECCGSGCKPCVFDVYEDRLRQWQSKQESVHQSKALNQMKYLPFLITEIQDVSESIKIFQFQAVTVSESNLTVTENGKLHAEYEKVEEFLNIKPGEYLIMRGASEGETISRSYTPVLDKESFSKGVFSVVISLQPNGKMSEFLRRLEGQEIVFWRGPYKELVCDLSSFKHVLLFGGGTGVVPLYNIAKGLVEDTESETWVKVFASFKSTRSILLRSEWGVLRDFWNFQMDVYVTNENGSVNFRAKHKESVIYGRIDESVVQREVGKCEGDKFFVIVCGPQGFNSFFKTCFSKLGVKEENIFIFY